MNDTFMKEKPIFPLLTSMALPMVVSMLVNALYNIVDSLFVARISEEAMTALSLVYPVQNLINAIAIGFSIGIAALIILVFSTVTTTFLDAWSAGISAESLSAKLNGKKTAIAVTVIGTAAAILFPMDDITGFLYLIGSVFAPMIAVQIADHFILHRDRFAVAADARNLVIWLVGFIAYRLLMGVDTPVGYTLPDMVLTVVLCLLAEKAKPTKQM
jgi:purine-cytosine permease-like protein